LALQEVDALGENFIEGHRCPLRCLGFSFLFALR
jgi:hypothetical protein